MAATPTRTITTTPASTPIERRVKNDEERVDQVRIRATRTEAVRMAGTGVRVRSLTSDSFSGRTRSKAQANSVRMGMKVLPTIAGRFQNRKVAAIATLTTGLRARRLANRLKYGATGRGYFLGTSLYR